MERFFGDRGSVLGAAAIIAASALGLGSTAWADGLDCTLIFNGSFGQGQTGWTFDPLEEMSGDAFSSAGAAVGDGTNVLDGDGMVFDEAILWLSVNSMAGQADGLGSSEAEITASTTVTATGRYLQIRRAGGFEFVYFGQGGRSLTAMIEVTGPDDLSVKEVLYDFESAPGSACEPGLAVLGTFNENPAVLQMDLAPYGFEVGDEVTISVSLRATSRVTEFCQAEATGAVLVLDDFEFCGAASDADVNGDGVVDIQDLVAVVLAWGACPTPPGDCPADIDGDGLINVSDLLAVLLDWSV